MLTTGGTAARIDAFESRFTTVNGAHFLIAADGREAWPISAPEADEYRALYRRRMIRARWLRRGALLAIVPLLVLMAHLVDAPPGRMGLGWQIAYFLVIFCLPLFGSLQHPVTSDLTSLAIERRLARRITTRFGPAVTPDLTPLGRLARRLFLFVVLAEIGIGLIHVAGGTDALAQHMRVLTGFTSGNEGGLAWATGTIGRLLPVAFLAAALFAMMDRRRRREAAQRVANATRTGR